MLAPIVSSPTDVGRTHLCCGALYKPTKLHFVNRKSPLKGFLPWLCWVRCFLKEESVYNVHS